MDSKSPKGPSFLPKTIGAILQAWRQPVVFRQPRSSVRIELDKTPSGNEEYEDWLDPQRLEPLTWNPDQARVRIDAISRRLARYWSIFLVYLIFAQGIKTGVKVQIPFSDWQFHILPVFKLEPTEFIAVVTTTTASVFGFLVIVSRALFKNEAATNNAD